LFCDNGSEFTSQSMDLADTLFAVRRRLRPSEYRRAASALDGSVVRQSVSPAAPIEPPTLSLISRPALPTKSIRGSSLAEHAGNSTVACLAHDERDGRGWRNIGDGHGFSRRSCAHWRRICLLDQQHSQCNLPPRETVLIPAGSQSATFTISTTAVATSTTVTITGSYNTFKQTGIFTIVPSFSLSISPSSLIGLYEGGPATGTVTLSGPASDGTVDLEQLAAPGSFRAGERLGNRWSEDCNIFAQRL
jgi:hypothetical protein